MLKIQRKTLIRIRRPSTLIYRNYSKSKEDLKQIILPADMEKEYKESVFGKLEKINKNKEFTDAVRSIFVFKDYIIPDRRKDPEFARLISKAYLYLLVAKGNNVLMPYFIKNGINAVTLQANPYSAALFFLLYGGASLSASYFDGLKTVENSKVVQTAWYKISMRAYKKLLELDL